jgi:PEP-CTERM motif
MSHSTITPRFAVGLVASALASVCWATPFTFSTGDPDGKIATASRPGTGAFEIESADDFVLTNNTSITSATFTGLIVGGVPLGNITNVVVEIYRVFPLDSDVGRTSGAPTFSTSQVPTRVNSPSDVAADSRDSAAVGDLTFTPTELSASFTANNSVQPGGIHPKPGQTTGGDGPVTGEEVLFTIAFTDPFQLAAGHYFFVPQVAVAGGTFLWLSAPKPIVPPGTPFPAGSTDLQSWTRDQFLDPDWLRIGTDIVGPPATGGSAPTFNAAFSLAGTVPEPGSLLLVGAGLLAAWWYRRRRNR